MLMANNLADNEPYQYKWWIFIAATLAMSVIFIDQTAVGVALPSIQRSLNSSATAMQWIVNAYTMAIAAMVIFAGKVVDTLGARRTYLLGILIFTLASISTAMAMSGWWAIASRALQGVGAAFMLPSGSVMLTNAFPPQQRGRVFGLYISVASVFLTLGPVIAGVLTHYLSWRWVFWINFPFAVASAILTFIFVQQSTHSIKKSAIDWQGFACLGIAICSLTFSLMELPNLGWQSPVVIVGFLLAVTVFVLFIFVERKVKTPLVDVSLFQSKPLNKSLCTLVMVQFCFSAFIYWQIFFQNVLAFNPSQTGLLFLPLTIPIFFMAPLGGYLRDRFGVRLPLVIGSSLILVGIGWMGLVAHLHSYWFLLPTLLMLGCGAPLVMSPAMATAMTAVEMQHRGAASGLAIAARQLGATLGVAAIGAIIVNLNRHQLESFLAQSVDKIGLIKESQIDGLLAGASAAMKAIGHLSPSLQQFIHQQAVNSYTFAFSIAMFVVAAIALLNLLLALGFRHRISYEDSKGKP